MEVRAFKLVNSEIVLGELVGTTNEKYQIKNPMAITYSTISDSPRLFSWCPYASSDTVEINVNCVIVDYVVNDKTLEKYNSVITNE